MTMKNLNSDHLRLSIDDLAQVSGGAEPTAADYQEAIDGIIAVYMREIFRCDMTTPDGIVVAQYFWQEMNQSVLDIIGLCEKKTGVVLKNPLLMMPNPLHNS